MTEERKPLWDADKISATARNISDMIKGFAPLPHPDKLKAVEDALWAYYELCLPDYDEGDIYDLTRLPMAEVEQTIRRLYKPTQEANR